MDELLKKIDLNEMASLLGELIITYGTNLIGAIVVLAIGLWVIKLITKGVGVVLDKKEVDPSITSFIKSFLNIALKAMLFISVLTKIGVEMTSFVALIGAAGLAIGMALSGTLQNFAGGVMILLFKPFKVGDFIDAQGHKGTVSEIKIFNTILKTPDNQVIIIPNGGLSTSSMVNITTEKTRRVEWNFGIAYGDSYHAAKELLLKLIKADHRVLSDPEPFIALSELGDNAINIVVRVWVQKENFGGVLFGMNEKVYVEFPKAGLSFPYPQMDVHIQK
ncbi:MAG: small conductance mechanosensitive channel [Saprospiraceae bacterium]|jgi:small conductance mechanosensitive channel